MNRATLSRQQSAPFQHQRLHVFTPAITGFIQQIEKLRGYQRVLKREVEAQRRETRLMESENDDLRTELRKIKWAEFWRKHNITSVEKFMRKFNNHLDHPCDCNTCWRTGRFGYFQDAGYDVDEEQACTFTPQFNRLLELYELNVEVIETDEIESQIDNFKGYIRDTDAHIHFVNLGRNSNWANVFFGPAIFHCIEINNTALERLASMLRYMSDSKVGRNSWRRLHTTEEDKGASDSDPSEDGTGASAEGEGGAGGSLVAVGGNLAPVAGNLLDQLAAHDAASQQTEQ